MEKSFIRRIFILVSLVCVFTSCSQEVLDSVIEKNGKDENTEAVDLSSLKATLVDFSNITMADEFPDPRKSTPLTRSTIITDSEGAYQLVWAETDTIGIFPSTGS